MYYTHYNMLACVCIIICTTNIRSVAAETRPRVIRVRFLQLNKVMGIIDCIARSFTCTHPRNPSTSSLTAAFITLFFFLSCPRGAASPSPAKTVCTVQFRDHVRSLNNPFTRVAAARHVFACPCGIVLSSSRLLLCETTILICQKFPPMCARALAFSRISRTHVYVRVCVSACVCGRACETASRVHS